MGSKLINYHSTDHPNLVQPTNPTYHCPTYYVFKVGGVLISFFDLLDPVPIFKENIDCEKPKNSSNSEIGSENPPGPGV